MQASNRVNWSVLQSAHTILTGEYQWLGELTNTAKTEAVLRLARRSIKMILYIVYLVLVLGILQYHGTYTDTSS